MSEELLDNSLSTIEYTPLNVGAVEHYIDLKKLTRTHTKVHLVEDAFYAETIHGLKLWNWLNVQIGKRRLLAAFVTSTTQSSVRKSSLSSSTNEEQGNGLNITSGIQMLHITLEKRVGMQFPFTIVEELDISNIDVILGTDFIYHFNVVLDVNRRKASMHGKSIRLNVIIPGDKRPFPPSSKTMSTGDELDNQVYTLEMERMQPYPRSQEKQALLIAEVERLLEDGSIRQSTSKWASPVDVAIAHGSPRLVVNYTELNRLTVRDEFPLPTIPTFSSHLYGNTLFSVLHLEDPLENIPIAEEDRYKTAFNTPIGQFEFNRMPGGLKNAGRTRQRFYKEMFGELYDKTVIACGTKLLIHTSGELSEHEEALRTVYNILNEHEVNFDPTKSQIAQEKVEFISHEFSLEGYRSTYKKIKRLKKFPPPQSREDLMRFLSIMDQFSPFIPCMIERMEDFIELSRKHVQYKWNPAIAISFQVVKSEVARRRLLLYPDLSKSFNIHTLEDDNTFHAVLFQTRMQEPISYAAFLRKEKDLRSKYRKRRGAPRLQIFSWAFEAFHDYIRSHNVILHTTGYSARVRRDRGRNIHDSVILLEFNMNPNITICDDSTI